MNRSYLLAMLAVLPLASAALEFDELRVTNEGKRYFVYAAGIIDAPAADVLAAITDFPNLHALSDTILESEYLGEGEGDGQLVRTRIEFCVMFICNRATQVQIVTFPDEWQVVSTAVPEQSDIDELTQLWTVIPEGDQSRFVYEMDVLNEEFIPPLLGPPLVRRKLRLISRDTARNIERIARISASATATEVLDEG